MMLWQEPSYENDEFPHSTPYDSYNLTFATVPGLAKSCLGIRNARLPAQLLHTVEKSCMDFMSFAEDVEYS